MSRRNPENTDSLTYSDTTMNHFKTLWLVSWLAVASVAAVLGMRGADRQPVTEVPVTSASLKSPSAPAYKNIEDLRVGDRVMGEWSTEELQGLTQVDPQSWRRYTLYAEMEWPDGTVDDVHIETSTKQPANAADLRGTRQPTENDHPAAPPPASAVWHMETPAANTAAAPAADGGWPRLQRSTTKTRKRPEQAATTAHAQANGYSRRWSLVSGPTHRARRRPNSQLENVSAAMLPCRVLQRTS